MTRNRRRYQPRIRSGIVGVMEGVHLDRYEQAAFFPEGEADVCDVEYLLDIAEDINVIRPRGMDAEPGMRLEEVVPDRYWPDEENPSYIISEIMPQIFHFEDTDGEWGKLMEKAELGQPADFAFDISLSYYRKDDGELVGRVEVEETLPRHSWRRIEERDGIEFYSHSDLDNSLSGPSPHQPASFLEIDIKLPDDALKLNDPLPEGYPVPDYELKNEFSDFRSNDDSD